MKNIIRHKEIDSLNFSIFVNHFDIHNQIIY